MSCTIRINKNGNLSLRLFFQGREWQERIINRGKPAKDTPANRQRLQARAQLINEEMEAGTFQYLKWFPNGNRAHEFKPKASTDNSSVTVGEYYREWIERRKPPFVRPGLHYDYTRQFRRYILPRFEDVRIVDVRLPDLESFRSYLHEKMGLSPKSCRNIIDGTFRAMMRDARTNGIGEKDHFAALKWPRIPSPKPDPFTADERDAILNYFREKQRFYYPFVATAFGTGARLSEIIALRFGDVDSNSGIVSINKSRYMQTDSPTKTAASEREILLGEPIIALLGSTKPLHVTETDFVFKNQEGNPINEDKWRAKYWYRALRVLNIRPRKFYGTRHTFISDALSQGLNTKWVAEYCGTSIAMIEKHYGRYIKSDSREQLAKLFDIQPGTFAGTPHAGERRGRRQVVRNARRKGWSGRVDLNHRPHAPQACALPGCATPRLGKSHTSRKPNMTQ